MSKIITPYGVQRIIQITDTHLFANDTDTIFNVCSNSRFSNVIENILQNDKPDNQTIVFLTGDVSQDGSNASYIKAIDGLTKLNIPIYWVPGNHDNLNTMNSVLMSAKNFFSVRRLIFPKWDFIFLNTKLDGAEYGYLSEKELCILNEELALQKEKKIALVMHHHPLEVGTPLIDEYILKNCKQLWDVIIGTNVKLIMCGHVHGDYSIDFNGIRIESAPATCLQWKKGTSNLTIVNQIGYKVYIYNANKNEYDTKSKIW